MNTSENWAEVSSARVYMWSSPMIDLAEINRFLEDNRLTWRRTPGATPGEELVEVSGRVCYLSFGEAQSARTNTEYIANLVESGHGSVLEHAVWTLAISGVSRAFTHQLVRHRPGFAYSQLSQQYHDERNMEPVIPMELRQHPHLREVWESAIRSNVDAYRTIMDDLQAEEPRPGEDQKEKNRRARSTARSILPEATRTIVVVSANARSWRHFLEVRGKVLGDHEMRIVSTLVHRALVASAPSLFNDYVEVLHSDNLPLVVSRG